MGKETVVVEVACAFCDPQRLVRLELPLGSTIADAIDASAIASDRKDVDIGNHLVGIFSRLRERDTLLKDGDRVEIYEPLKEDYRQRRRAEGAK